MAQSKGKNVTAGKMGRAGQLTGQPNGIAVAYVRLMGRLAVKVLLDACCRCSGARRITIRLGAGIDYMARLIAFLLPLFSLFRPPPS